MLYNIYLSTDVHVDRFRVVHVSIITIIIIFVVVVVPGLVFFPTCFIIIYNILYSCETRIKVYVYDSSSSSSRYTAAKKPKPPLAVYAFRCKYTYVCIGRYCIYIYALTYKYRVLYKYIYTLLYITCADALEGGVCGTSDKRHGIAFKRLVHHFGIWARFLYSQSYYHNYCNMYRVRRVIVENPKNRFGDLSNYAAQSLL